MSSHVFVDESKNRDYLLAAAVVMPADLAVIRRTVRALVLPGQRRVHMAKESDPRRRAIVSAIVSTRVSASVYNAGRGGRDELSARAACLRAVVSDAAARGSRVLVLERDDSLQRWDLQQLIEITRDVGCRDTLAYEHRRARDEQLLAIPDAIAWCWARGGRWRASMAPILTSTRSV